MRILLTGGAATPRGSHLGAALRSAHRLRPADTVPLAREALLVRSDLGHDADTERLLSGVAAVVHLARRVPPAAPASDWPQDRLERYWRPPAPAAGRRPAAEPVPPA